MRWVILVLAAGCEFRPDWVPSGPDGASDDPPGVVPPEADAGAGAPPVTDAPGSPASDADEGEEEETTTLPIVTWNGRLWAWDRNGSNTGYPQFSGSEVTLTPNVNDRAGVIFLAEPLDPPFTIAFEYLTFDDDGCRLSSSSSCRWTSGDGWVFMFAKDVHAYETASPPTGAARSFISDGTGVGIHFELYDQRGISLKDGALQAIDRSVLDTYSEFWRPVVIDVREDRVEVFVDGSSAFRYDAPDGAWDTSHRWIGIGAATGGAAAVHKIRGVTIEH
jgi:hypothetical protein